MAAAVGRLALRASNPPAAGWPRRVAAVIPSRLRPISARGPRATSLVSCSAAAGPTSATAPPTATAARQGRCLICTSVTASTVAACLAEIEEAAAAGADIVELRLDFLAGATLLTDPGAVLAPLLAACAASSLPAIVTFRPAWEGGRYSGPEGPRLAALRDAVARGAAYIDVELKAAGAFWADAAAAGEPYGSARRLGNLGAASKMAPGTSVPLAGTRLILSSHDFGGTSPSAHLTSLHAAAVSAGADVVKVATTAADITDAGRTLGLLDAGSRSGVPTIALAMGEAGQIRRVVVMGPQPVASVDPPRLPDSPSLPSRLLAPKLGGYLTFGALSRGRESAPGQPTVAELKTLYRLPTQTAGTRVFGVIGSPISHSRSPAIHNAALVAAGVDAVYVPLLVSDLPSFLRAFDRPEYGFGGFSVTIPHKEAALAACAEVDPVAMRIGAVNTLVRRPQGGYKGYNTDSLAAIDAVLAGLGGCERALVGLTAVVVGAGGAGRALAFGAAERGAKVVVVNRTRARAEELASAVGGEAASWEDLQAGEVRGDVLLNTTSLGLSPRVDETPVPASALARAGYELVFDAIYNPLETRLLRDAAAAGAKTVGGAAMFVGQAEAQFELFTGRCAPAGLMRSVLLACLDAKR